MKRLGLLSLVLFLVVALFSEVVARDFRTAKTIGLPKKAKVQSFRESEGQALPSLFTSSSDDAGTSLADELFHSILGLGSRYLPNCSDRILSFHTLEYRYLFLPPPA
ncbi:hypothetical protein EHQ53_15035 [Leptospira langatensis]|uniref:Uncharacterized protein n=1 Tax=Leptospira langatensis TaxID=2484983 RepID=A0A5F1ZSA7_9LEPT|nr:hypothetical protein [Leptospira langatensis]TGK01788.1 hypothetical protein EHO57_08275 [Leptospira langatensis]TGL39395.1 hypothetical protein EHQ53_15035 [Leptospira langatensis]